MAQPKRRLGPEMAIPASRAELIVAVETTFAKLADDLARVPEDRARDLSMPGHVTGSLMSAADLVAYLIGWNRQVLTWHARRDAGLPDEFPASGVAWNELGSLAQRYYSEHTTESWTQLLLALRNVHAEILALVHCKSDDELYGAPWYGKWTMGRMISLNTASPYTNARRRIRAWLRTM